jgi:hypothetical protein
LANKVLERNKDRNKPGTEALKSVPLSNQPVPPNGTNSGADDATQYDALSYEFEERLAIAEYDGQQTPKQAQHIAYLDAFISVLTTIPQETLCLPYGEDWLDARIMAAKDWLQAQNLFQPK